MVALSKVDASHVMRRGGINECNISEPAMVASSSFLASLVIWIHLLSAPVSHAQARISPLFSFLTTNSGITRQATFRELHRRIAEKYDGVTPGVRLDILYDLTSAVRDRALGAIRSLTPIVDAASIRLASSFDTLAARSPIASSATPLSTLSDLRQPLAALLSQVLAEDVFGVIEDKQLKQGVAFAARSALSYSGITPSATISPSADNVEQLAYEMADGLIHLVIQRVQRTVTAKSILSSSWGEPDSKVRTQTSAELAVALRDAMTDVQASFVESLISAFSHVETTLTQLTSDVSSLLAAGNAGLAIVRDTGDIGSDVGGGIHVSYVFNSVLRAGVFFSGQLNPPDSGNPSPFLGGFQVQGSFGNVQLDLLASLLIPDSTHTKTLASYEFGLGASYNAGSVILGLACFALQQQDLDTMGGSTGDPFWRLSLGLQLRSPEPAAPSFTLAWDWNEATDRVRPVFQVGVPLTSQ